MTIAELMQKEREASKRADDARKDVDRQEKTYNEAWEKYRKLKNGSPEKDDAAKKVRGEAEKYNRLLRKWNDLLDDAHRASMAYYKALKAAHDAFLEKLPKW